MFVALGVGLPGLVLQDSFRFAFFASGRGVYAFVNDLCWGLLLILALFLLHYQGQGTAVNCLLAFGATATLAAVLGAMQARALPRPLRAAYWVRTHRKSLGSLSCREPEQQRRLTAAFLRAGSRGKSCGCRLRTGF